MIFRKLRRVARITCERGIRHLLQLRCNKRCGPDRVEGLTINGPEALWAAARFNSTTARKKRILFVRSWSPCVAPPSHLGKEGRIAIVTIDAVDAMARVLFSFARQGCASGRHPAFAAPSCFRGGVLLESSDAIPRRESAGARELQSGVASGEGLREASRGRNRWG